MNKPIALATLAITTGVLASFDQPTSTAQVKKAPAALVTQAAPVLEAKEVYYTPPPPKPLPLENVLRNQDDLIYEAKRIGCAAELETAAKQELFRAGVLYNAVFPNIQLLGTPTDAFYILVVEPHKLLKESFRKKKFNYGLDKFAQVIKRSQEAKGHTEEAAQQWRSFEAAAEAFHTCAMNSWQEFEARYELGAKEAEAKEVFHTLEPLQAGDTRYACTATVGEPNEKYYIFKSDGTGSMRTLLSVHECKMNFNWAGEQDEQKVATISSEKTSNNENCGFQRAPKITLTADQSAGHVVLKDLVTKQTLYCTSEAGK